MSTILVVILILLLAGLIPAHGHIGAGPSGLLGVLLVVLIVLALMGRI